MKENGEQRKEVIERYCPRKGENVIMLRTHGITSSLECLNYSDCRLEKSKFCGGGAEENVSTAEL